MVPRSGTGDGATGEAPDDPAGDGEAFTGREALRLLKGRRGAGNANEAAFDTFHKPVRGHS